MVDTQYNTPITFVHKFETNDIYIKREDLYPFSFGGNKARKGSYFYEDILNKKSDYIVTYGSSSSNHARVIANIAAKLNIPCMIISPYDKKKETYNKKINDLLGAKYIFANINEISSVIDKTVNNLKEQGYNPYFIRGGGHETLGTKAYIDCYKEILNYENINNTTFDYIFFASGTGTTQAGLCVGNYLNKDEKNIIGISIARKSEYGKKIIEESIEEYFESSETLRNSSSSNIKKKLKFEDEFIAGGYGNSGDDIKICIDKIMKNYGIPLDETYTGKAWYGMEQLIKRNKIRNKNILFLHTGGTPLFFDYLNR